jgi:hypothetical protein
MIPKIRKEPTPPLLSAFSSVRIHPGGLGEYVWQAGRRAIEDRPPRALDSRDRGLQVATELLVGPSCQCRRQKPLFTGAESYSRCVVIEQRTDPGPQPGSFDLRRGADKVRLGTDFIEVSTPHFSTFFLLLHPPGVLKFDQQLVGFLLPPIEDRADVVVVDDEEVCLWANGPAQACIGADRIAVGVVLHVG